MNDELIKDIIEKIKLWWKNLFKKKKIIKKDKQQKNIQEKELQVKKHHIKINLNNENKSSSIGTLYPKLSKKNLLLLNKKTNTLKHKVSLLDLKNNNLNIDTINDILNTINKNELYINQAIEINHLLNNINSDTELNLNTNEKLNILKDNISIIINQKLDDYQTSIIKKAYSEYNSVNYVIMTTLLIDDIIDEINELNNDFKKIKYTKIEYERKISQIKDKINKLEIINNRKEVIDEIENLRKDFYTKKKDKYDLLYNNEIFINLNNKCDELLNIININEKEQKYIKINLEKETEKKKNEIQKKQETLKKKRQEQEEKKKKEQEFNENVIKRFIDMEFAHRLLLLREGKRNKLLTKEQIINHTISYYNDFLLGEQHEFNFERNKVKTEITKLYNDISSVICNIEKKEFVPLEHINIKLEILTEATIEKQTTLNNLIEKKYNYKIEEDNTNKRTTAKLNTILTKEKDKENKKENSKVLKKELNSTNNNNKSV